MLTGLQVIVVWSLPLPLINFNIMHFVFLALPSTCTDKYGFPKVFIEE